MSGIAHVQQLQHLALGDQVGGVGEDPHDFGMRSSSTISWKLREYRKSPTSTLAALPQTALAVLRPRRRSDSSTTSSCSRVAVWMNSTTAASWCASGPRCPSAPRRQQQQHRPQALAAGADDVFGDLVDQHHVGGQAAPDQRVDRGHVVAGQGLDRGQVGKVRGAMGSGTGAARLAAIQRAKRAAIMAAVVCRAGAGHATIRALHARTAAWERLAKRQRRRSNRPGNSQAKRPRGRHNLERDRRFSRRRAPDTLPHPVPATLHAIRNGPPKE